MILRNAAVRHGRSVAMPPSRRTLTTQQLTQLRAVEDSMKYHIFEMGKIESRIKHHEKLSTITSKEEYTAATRSFEIEQLRRSDAEEKIRQQRIAVIRAQNKAANLARQMRSDRGSSQQYKSNKKRLHVLGSVTKSRYEPQALVTKPTAAHDVSLELLMASQTHMGHSTSLWNPANQQYIHGIRQGIHIISLEVTAAHLRRAAKIVEGVAYHGGLILFVGTRKGQERAVVAAAANAKGCHLFERWLPGTITNSEEILGASEMVAVDEFDQKLENEIYDKKLYEYKALKPDLVVCLNPLENYVCLRECAQNHIPTIGIIDTDADATWVTYPIPANDDSLRSTDLIVGALGLAGKAGQEARLEAAKNGIVTWKTDDELRAWIKEDKEWFAKYLEEERLRKKAKREAKEARESGRVPNTRPVMEKPRQSVFHQPATKYPDASRTTRSPGPEGSPSVVQQLVTESPVSSTGQGTEGAAEAAAETQTQALSQSQSPQEADANLEDGQKNIV